MVTALERLVGLFSNAGDPAALRKMLVEVGPKAAMRFRAFAKAVAQGDADMVMEVGIPGRTQAATVSVSRAEATRLVEFLDVEAQQVREPFAFRGYLVGVSLRTKFFRLEDDERDVSGRIAEDYVQSMRGKTIGHRYDANIVAVTDINEATGQERVRNILINMEAVLHSDSGVP